MFIVYQAYILKKKTSPAWNEKHPFPKDVDYMIADTFEFLRPKLKVFTTMEEAISAVESLNKDYQEQIGEYSLSLGITVNDTKSWLMQYCGLLERATGSTMF